MLKIKSLVLLSGMLACGSAAAAENGNISWPIGVNTVLNGVATQAGETRLYNYSLYYKSDRLADSDGHRLPVSTDVDIFVDAIRMDHGWARTWGSVHFATGFVLPIANVSLDIAGSKSSSLGIGNLSLKPLIIGTHNASMTFFQQIALLDLDVPSGSYNSDRSANVALHFYSWQPNYGWTWFVNPKVEIGGTLSAAINTKNHDTDYHAGWMLHYEQLVAYALSESVQLGIQGFYFRQMSDDKQDGKVYDGGYRTRGAALGPQLRYTIRPGVAVVAKYQHEFASENRALGDRFWLQFTLPL
ncbi:SphA family protein [Solimonas marina]|uniref:Phenol degradation protein meta n=1 Tax=Solimonas marina TaxID=2714601 RepID=A0A970B5Z6_9GAMM|nr:transporter [Solimonas marina]NKF22253.1 phenol degradation protein meta [Solimonas marina]